MNLTKPLFSVITVVFNGENHIEKTIQSVINQSYKNFEYIIIDGKSNDNTLAIVETYKNQIEHIVSEKDSGIYNAMNKGATLAKGIYTIFLNSGDTFADDSILQKIAEASDSLKCDVIYGNVLKYSGNDLIEKVAEKPGNKHRMYFCHQSSAVLTSILQSNPFDEKYKMSSDFKLFKVLYKNKASFYKVDFSFSIFDTSGVSNTSRSEGLLENIKIINECDKGLDWLILMVRILPSYFTSKLKSK